MLNSLVDRKMVKIGIIGCKIMMDSICPGCIKCFNALHERVGKFSILKDENAEVLFLTSCNGCPGPITMKIDLINRVLDSFKNNVDIVFIATCILRAIELFKCPIDIETLKLTLESLGYKVVIGTHPYPIYAVGKT